MEILSLHQPTKTTLEGPAILLQDTRGRILCVLENQDKAWKKKGQFFVPAGGKEDFEHTMEETCIREIREESGLDDTYISKKYLKKTGEIPFIGEDFEIGVHVYKYTQALPSTILDNLAHSHIHEISDKIFLDVPNILSLVKDRIRPGLYEILYNALLEKDIPYEVRIADGGYEGDEFRSTYASLHHYYR